MFARTVWLRTATIALVLAAAFKAAHADPDKLRSAYADQLAANLGRNTTAISEAEAKPTRETVEQFLTEYEKLEEARSGFGGSVAFGFSGNAANSENAEGKGT